MSLRARTRAHSRPWEQSKDDEPMIDWTSIAAEKQMQQMNSSQEGDDQHVSPLSAHTEIR
jgi:hypothetical protein